MSGVDSAIAYCRRWSRRRAIGDESDAAASDAVSEAPANDAASDDAAADENPAGSDNPAGRQANRRVELIVNQ